MPTRVRLAFVLAFTVAVSAGCETGSGAQPSAGQGGIALGFGASDGRDCSASSAGEGGASASCPESAPVDYATEVAPILGTCRGEVCHDFTGPAGIVSFIGASADECCGQRELIAPGHPERSYLVDKLKGQRLCYGTRMPPNRGPLLDAELAVVQAWICQGAVMP